MGLNFQYYDGLQPKIRVGIINEHECNGLSTLDVATLYMNLDVSWISLKIMFENIVEKDPGNRQVTPLQLAAIQDHLKTSEMILDEVVDKNPNQISTKKINEELLDALKLF